MRQRATNLVSLFQYYLFIYYLLPISSYSLHSIDGFSDYGIHFIPEALLLFDDFLLTPAAKLFCFISFTDFTSRSTCLQPHDSSGCNKPYSSIDRALFPFSVGSHRSKASNCAQYCMNDSSAISVASLALYNAVRTVHNQYHSRLTMPIFFILP